MFILNLAVPVFRLHLLFILPSVVPILLCFLSGSQGFPLEKINCFSDLKSATIKKSGKVTAQVLQVLQTDFLKGGNNSHSVSFRMIDPDENNLQEKNLNQKAKERSLIKIKIKNF
jgi:hypothetical protein